MKTNLSKLIKLERIPRRYYAPKNEVELTALTREEKVDTSIFESMTDAARNEAQTIAEMIKKTVAQRGRCVMAVGAGNGTHVVYSSLVDMCEKGEVSFKDVVVFNISEFFPFESEGPSTLARLHSVFLDKTDILPENIHSIDTAITREDMDQYCREYEAAIEEAGGIDIALCEIGAQGALAFNV